MPSFWITRRNGDRFEVLFDEADRDLVEAHKWHAHLNHGAPTYVIRNRGPAERTHVLLHQMIAARMNPAVSPIGWDHKNGNGFDNRRSNLRKANGSQQNAAQGKRKGCTSKYKGVSWNKKSGKWQAFIRDGVWHTYPSGERSRLTRRLGYFDSELEAATAYEKAARAAHGAFLSIALVADE